MADQAEALRARGASVMHLAVDQRLAGLLAVSGPIEAMTPDALAALKRADPAPAAMAAMPGCDGDMPRDMNSEQPQLCKAHCQQGEQVVGATPTCDWTPSPLLLAVIDWRQAALAVLPPACRFFAAPRQQRSQPLHELQRRHHQVRGAVAPRGLGCGTTRVQVSLH